MQTEIAQSPSPEHVDLSAPSVIADPYPAYHALRGSSPVLYARVPAGGAAGLDEPIRSYALLRHAEVLTALRDPQTFSSNVTDKIRVLPRIALLHDDPPRHTQLRRLVSRAFTPRRIAELEPWIGRLAASLLDATGDGLSELMGAYAIPLPMMVIATLLGIPAERYAQFRSWSESVVSYSGIPAEERASRGKAMVAFFAEQLEARRRAPSGDLISALVEAEIDGARLDTPEAVAFCVGLLVAGNDTTTNLLGNMLHILAARPELYRRAQQDRSLVEPIIEETLRHSSPVQRLLRVAARPVDVSGVVIPAGHLVDVVFGAANRDPAVFEDPDAFRIDRPPAEHLAFGHGIHFCFGASLARAEARIALNAILDRYAAIAPGEVPPLRQTRAMMPLGFESLPLVLRRRL
ncbi:cytochrome P450 [Sorangium sp. So ce1000]|uniref:cytochrome P450 n=1 Tax=Sorangium sp. So ce1000 TaxID=3133325 RepID=UPI003F634EDA